MSTSWWPRQAELNDNFVDFLSHITLGIFLKTKSHWYFACLYDFEVFCFVCCLWVCVCFLWFFFDFILFVFILVYLFLFACFVKRKRKGHIEEWMGRSGDSGISWRRGNWSECILFLFLENNGRWCCLWVSHIAFIIVRYAPSRPTFFILLLGRHVGFCQRHFLHLSKWPYHFCL